MISEMSLFGQQESSSVSVIAETYCSLYSLSRSDFQEIVHGDSQAQFEIARQMESLRKLRLEATEVTTVTNTGDRGNTKF